MKHIALHWRILIGMFLGIVFGFFNVTNNWWKIICTTLG